MKFILSVFAAAVTASHEKKHGSNQGVLRGLGPRGPPSPSAGETVAVSTLDLSKRHSLKVALSEGIDVSTPVQVTFSSNPSSGYTLHT